MNYPTQHSADRHAHTPSVTHRHQDDRADDLTDNNSLTEGDGISIASVRQATFVARYQAVWHEFDRLVDECGQSLYFDTKDNSQNNTQNNVQDDSRVQILGSDASLATKYGSGSKRSFWGRRDLDGRVAMRYPIVELYRQI